MMMQNSLKKAVGSRSASASAVAPRVARVSRISHVASRFVAAPTAAPSLAGRRAATLLVRAAYTEELSEADRAALETTQQVFVGNLAWGTSEEGIAEHFSSVPGLTRATLMMRDDRSRGMALVDYDSHDAAERAVGELHESELDGRTISVRLSLPRPRRERPAYGDNSRGERAPRQRYERPSYGDDGMGGGERRERRERRDDAPRERREPNPNAVRLFVSNLPFSAAWQDVKDHFGSAGRVDFVRVRTDPDGNSRGSAIVQMTDEGAAAAALADLHNSELGGRALNVRRWVEREAMPPREEGPGPWEE